MIDLVNVIQNECIPRRNCLLSVIDTSGESGFLYFKDGQLIEVNQGSVWGQHAFEVIANWQIENYNVGELPLGIKRTLWEPIDKMIEDVLGKGSADGVRSAFSKLPKSIPSSAAVEQAQKIKRETQRLALNKLQNLEECIAIYFEIEGKLQLLHSQKEAAFPRLDWLETFTGQCHALGKSIGAGNLHDLFIRTDTFCGWRIPIAKGIIFVFSPLGIDLETFELNMKEAVAPLL